MAPLDVRDRLTAALNASGQFASLITRAAHRGFHHRGHLTRHLRRMRRLYAEQQQTFVEQLGIAITARISEHSGMTPAITFAVGDIHGCHQALLDILEQCRDYAKGQPHRFVFIGDYIDRGPDSRSVIATVRALQQRAAGDVICLMGNHEDMLLDAIDTGDPLNWFLNGGMTTLASYGLRDPAQLPPEDIAWLRSLSLSFDDGKRFFAHAGVDPDLPLDRQPKEALVWIRERFHRAAKDYGRLIVHGHTPCRDARPEIRPNRINIDTACVYRGRLTAAVFTEDSVAPKAFLTARED